MDSERTCAIGRPYNHETSSAAFPPQDPIQVIHRQTLERSDVAEESKPNHKPNTGNECMAQTTLARAR